MTTGRLPEGWWGPTIIEHKIILRPRLGATQRRSVLAHEVAHAYFRHRGTNPMQEREASKRAVRKLIKSVDFIDALKVSEHRTGVAQIPSVMSADIDTYINSLSPREIPFIHRAVAKDEVC